MEEKKEEKQQRLNFRIIESTSEDPEHPLFELLKGNFLFIQVPNQTDGFQLDFVHSHKI